jgi:hypothetical protein
MSSLVRRAARLIVAASVGIVTAPALAAGAGPVGFYGDIGNAVGYQSPPVVRPSMLLLTENGSVALVHLRWKGWGSAIAQATGVRSASSCTPSCANGKRTTRKATLTLSRPGVVNGHRVYRCFQVRPPREGRDITDHACLSGQGAMAAYKSVSGG